MERNRWAKAFKIPMTESSPPNFPPLTLGLMRALCALSTRPNGQELLALALTKLWPEFWVKHAEIAKLEVFSKILAEVLGSEAVEESEYQAIPFTQPPLCAFLHSCAPVFLYLALLCRSTSAHARTSGAR